MQDVLGRGAGLTVRWVLGEKWNQWISMTHALRNYSRVSTRLWNNFFWNNFQGIIFEGGRYMIIHVGISKS